jgi:signal transduction histidine kinase
LRINKGKLSQIMDNFVLNSQYWLAEDIKHDRIKQGQIRFEVEQPFLRISDNGRGIDPSVEAALFEPFVSAKGRGMGRGLGLFIVKQLLDSEGCQVGIVPLRNKSGRLFKFQIDFRGATNG